MALALARSCFALRSAPALRSTRHASRRALAVRAFKDTKHDDKQAAPARAGSEDTAVAPSAQQQPPLPLEAVPIRRMTDAMVQMQREMDALLDHFDEPFFGRGRGGRRATALSPFSLLDSLTPGLPSLAAPSPSSLARAMGPLSRMVPIEVIEDDSSVTLTAEVPGFAKDHIKVTVDPARSTLTISGERSSDSTTEGAVQDEAHKGRSSHMSFTRSFMLPPEVALDQDIKATAEHGVLKVVLPKVPKHEPASTVRQIPVA